ncbi:PAS domain S-box protein [Ammoniphilus oxalaticus]|uniref:PAS domain S-box protein n=1 Tax=Ammoniphilus oxalaticus TaxID=66863 RepID=A0A419SRF9_9BACL|nr:PAS domain S-box protein [Ammoniphilus oxalaticus]
MLFEKDEKLKDVLRELADIKFALDQSSIVAITDHRGKILEVNEQFCKISQYDREELLGQDHRIVNSDYHSSDFFRDMWATIATGNIWRGEVKNKAKDGSFYWVDTTIVPFLDDDGRPYQYISLRNEITDRKRMEQELRRNEEKYRLITENSSDLISIIDGEANFQYVSPTHTIHLGHRLTELESGNLLQWVHPEDREIVSHGIQQMSVTKMMSSQLEFRVQKKSGNYIDVEARVSSILNETGYVLSFVLVMRDITDRKQSEQKIYHLAYHDTLTQLPNRRLFMDRIRKEVRYAKQFQSQLAIIFLDVDRFKQINDSWGHESGDLVLTEVGKRIKQSIRSNDLLARMGGDEFTVMLTNITDMKEAEQVAKRILDSFQKPIKIGKKKHTITCSLGISFFPSDGKSAEELIKRADMALYAVKDQGRNGYLFFDSEMEQRSLERILLEYELKKAIELEQFYMDYQPKVDLSTGCLVGMEALVRWKHPELGRIAPNKFIPVAEDTGLIVPLGEWIMRRGCEQAVEWQRAGYPPVKLSINLSVRQLFEPDLLPQIKAVLKDTGLEPQWLEFEVTESVFADLEDASIILQQIRALGIHISMDDFGTGYSSFSYLQHLPIDTLKIDPSFVRDIHLKKESQAIVKGILSIAETLNLNVIAEGIETIEQLTVLSEDGCSQGQGYLFSRPLSSQQFENYLQQMQCNKTNS